MIGDQSNAIERVRRIRCVVVFVSMLGVAVPLAAQSCPCASANLVATVKDAEVIFIGKVLTTTSDWDPETPDGPLVMVQSRAAFEVESLIKGSLPRFSEIVSPAGPCTYPFSAGERYLIAGMLGGGRVSTDACKGNVSGDSVEARAARLRQLQEQSSDPVRRSPD
jgi:hypothetical protein